MDVVGVFGYSDEDGTEAASFDGKLDEDEIREPAPSTSPRLVEELTAQRAEERVGEEVDVLVESIDDDDGRRVARPHQGPEVDGTHAPDRPAAGPGRRPGARRRRRHATASTWSREALR